MPSSIDTPPTVLKIFKTFIKTRDGATKVRTRKIERDVGERRVSQGIHWLLIPASRGSHVSVFCLGGFVQGIFVMPGRISAPGRGIAPLDSTSQPIAVKLGVDHPFHRGQYEFVTGLEPCCRHQEHDPG